MSERDTGCKWPMGDTDRRELREDWPTPASRAEGRALLHTSQKAYEEVELTPNELALERDQAQMAMHATRKGR